MPKEITPANELVVRQMLQKLAEDAGQNIDRSGQMIKDASKLRLKQIHDPNYQPSPEELSNEDQYYNSLVSAVAGSIAPIKAANPERFRRVARIVRKTPHGEEIKTIYPDMEGAVKGVPVPPVKPLDAPIMESAQPFVGSTADRYAQAAEKADALAEINPYTKEAINAALQKSNRLNALEQLFDDKMKPIREEVAAKFGNLKGSLKKK